MPPQAPYTGTFAGPGPSISDTPNRLSVTVLSRIDASIYSLRLGPCLEVPVCGRASVVLSGGPVIAIADSEFSYNETAPVSPVTYWSASARDSALRSVIRFEEVITEDGRDR